MYEFESTVKVMSLDFTYWISVSLRVLCCDQSKRKTLHKNTKLQQLLTRIIYLLIQSIYAN